MQRVPHRAGVHLLEAALGLRAAGGNVFGLTITMVKADDLPLYDSRPVRPVAYLGAA